MGKQYQKRPLTKKAKPKAEIQKSFVFQAEKVASKTVKVLKVFLVRKLLRKSAEEASVDGNNIPNSSTCGEDAPWMEKLKNLNHALVAKKIVEANFPECVGAVSRQLRGDKQVDEEEDGSVEAVYHRFATHKKVLELVKVLRAKYEDMVAKNNQLRAEEQRREDKAKNASNGGNSLSGNINKKNILAKRVIDRKEMAKGLFFDNLEDNAQEEVDKQAERRRKFRESGGGSKNVRPPSRVRKQRKEQEAAAFKEGDALPTDMSIYLPLEQRGPGAATSTAEYQERLMSMKQQDRKQTSSSKSSSGSNASDGSRSMKLPDALGSGGNIRNSSSQNDKSIASKIANGKEWKEAGVHPSWAAKQLAKKQTVTIAIPSSGSVGGAGDGGGAKYTGLTFAAQNKKIVFDD